MVGFHFLIFLVQAFDNLVGDVHAFVAVEDGAAEFRRHLQSQTRWRWGTAVGMLLPAVMDYKIDETATEEEFLFSGYMYLLGYADYALSAGEKSAFYLHGGLAPCWQNDKWTRHNEKKVSALMQLGVGMDFGYARMAFTGYASIHGDLGAFLSLGLYFGKKQNPNNN